MTPHEFHNAAGAPGVRTYRIAMSERCFRFKPEALDNHAPDRPGVYEFVAFDREGQEGRVVFVGLAEASIHEALAGHLAGTRAPSAEALFKKFPNAVYFDYIKGTDARSPEDFQDILGILIRRHKPEFNDAAAAPGSGRFAHVDLQEVEIV